MAYSAIVANRGTILKTIKRTALGISKGLGTFRMLENSRWRRERLTILCYHGIALDDEHLWDPELYMSVEHFRERLQLLAEGGYQVLPLGEAVQRLYARDLPPKSAAITFDDGTYDFYRQAYPALRHYGFPATVYLTTFYCRHPKPVFRLFCSYVLWKAGQGGGSRTVLGKGPFRLEEADQRNRALEAVTEYAAQECTSLEQRDALAERLTGELGLDYQTLAARRILQLMNAEEVREMVAGGIDIQLHTHRHRTPLDRSLFVREITDNRHEIEQMTGTEAVHFCYPSGVHRQEFLPWLAENGVLSATTCETGLATAEDHPLLLPRIVDHEGLAAIELEAWLSGVGSALPRRHRS